MSDLRERERQRQLRNTAPRLEGVKRMNDYNRCLEQQRASYKCLEDNNGDKTMCHEFFENYRDCLKSQRAQRLRDNARRTGSQ